MKREHIEMLWNACAGSETGYLMAKEKTGIPEDIWGDWLKKKIVADSIVPPDAFLEHLGLNYPAVIRKDDNGQFWAIPDPADETERFRIERSDVELFPVRLNMLAHHIALAWGIKRDFKVVIPEGFLIGWQEGNLPVVLLYALKGNIVTQALTVKENLGVSILYVIAIGDIPISVSERERLRDDGVVFAGTKEFLSPEGIPLWDTVKRQDSMPSLAGTPWDYYEATDTICFNNEPINASPTQKILLQTMLRNRWSVVSQENLAAAVNEAFEGTSKGQFSVSSVKDHIYRLKQRSPEEARKWIINFPKRGYGVIQPAK